MNKQDAMRLLDLSGHEDYKITKIYENGFKAIRTNEWIKSELYCEVLTDNVKSINENNYYDLISIAVMVIERYQ